MSQGRTSSRLAKAKKVGLPARPFLYTLDQIAGLLALSQPELESNYIYFWGRSEGSYLANGDRLKAVNIAPKDQKPEWRVSEEELVNWCFRVGLVAYH